MAKVGETNESQKDGNTEFLNTIRRNPKGVEQLVSSYFDGFTRPDGKQIPPAGKNEVFYFNLGVPAEHLSQVYAKQDPKEPSTSYNEISKFYRDQKGQLKNYNNAQELKGIATEMTKMMEEIGQYASNNYSAASQAKLSKLYGSEAIRNFENLMSPERAGDATDVVKKGEFKDPHGQTFHKIEPIKDYQEALDTARAALRDYKAIAKQLKKEPVVAYSSQVDMGSEGVTKQDLSNAFLRAICDQKAITGLDPKDPDFKAKLAIIDPKSLKGIEVAFLNNTTKTIESYKIDGAKFLEALQQIDPKSLPEQKFSDLKFDDRTKYRKEIATQLEKINLFEKGQISEKFMSAISSPKTIKLKQKSKKTKSKTSNHKNRLSSQPTKGENTNIIFADRAQAVIVSNKAQSLSDSKTTPTPILQTAAESTHKAKDSGTIEPSRSTGNSLEGITKLAGGNFKVDSPKTVPIQPVATRKAVEELTEKLQKRPVLTPSDFSAKPQSKTSELASSIPKTEVPQRKVEGPTTKSGMKPLPPTPTQISRPELKNKPLPLTPPQKIQDSVTKPSMKPLPPIPTQTSRPELKNKPLPLTPPQKIQDSVTKTNVKPLPPIPTQISRPELKNKPLPLTPPQKEQLRMAQQILKKDGMELKSDQKTVKPPANVVKIGMHRGAGANKDTHTH